MTPALLKQFAGVAVRAFLLILGAHGVELTPDDQDSLLRVMEMLCNAALILGPIVWSLYQKWSTQQDLLVANLKAELAERR